MKSTTSRSRFGSAAALICGLLAAGACGPVAQDHDLRGAWADFDVGRRLM
jgi:hypothetical protein